MSTSLSSSIPSSAGSPQASQATRWLAWANRLAPWLIWLAFLALYAATAAPSIVELFDDSLEFQLVVPTFGIAHPTGYPLYVLLGGLWSRVLFPFGNWAWRVNIFSALAGAAAVALVYVAARRLLPHAGSLGLTAALAAAVTFGLGPVWWDQATMAEVYALQNLLAAAVLATVLGIEGSQGRAFDRRMALLALLVGLGLAHHRTTVLLIPAVAVYLLWSVPRIWRPRRIWLLWLALLLAPLLLYLFLPLRATVGVRDLHGSYRNTLTGFLDHVLARGYTGFFSTLNLAPDRSPAAWMQVWLAQLGWVGAVLAVIGLGWLLRPRSVAFKGWSALLLVAAVNLAFALFYHVGDQQVFMIPAFLAASVFAGGGLALLAGALPERRQGLVGVAGVALLLVNPGRGPWVNRSHDWAVHDYAVDMAKVDFPAGSRVIGLEGEMSALKYMQQAQGLGNAAKAVVADDPGRRRKAVAAGLAAGAPVYLTRELEGIADQYSFTGEGPLVRVWPRGQAQAGQPAFARDDAMAGGRLVLEGYDLQRLDWAGGPVIRMALYWRPQAPLTETLKVSLRLVGPDGAPLTLPDGAPAVMDRLPLRQVAPTSTWVPGQLVRDVYEVAWPPSAQPGSTKVQLILYDSNTLEEQGRIEAPAPG